MEATQKNIEEMTREELVAEINGGNCEHSVKTLRRLVADRRLVRIENQRKSEQAPRRTTRKQTAPTGDASLDINEEYLRLLRVAGSNGYKIGWAWFRLVEKFGKDLAEKNVENDRAYWQNEYNKALYR